MEYLLPSHKHHVILTKKKCEEIKEVLLKILKKYNRFSLLKIISDKHEMSFWSLENLVCVI